MKHYETPKFEIIAILKQDIVTSSSVGDIEFPEVPLFTKNNFSEK